MAQKSSANGTYRIDELGDKMRIEMVETSLGCPEGCKSCGAYDDYRLENMKVIELSEEKLYKHLTQIVGKQRKRLIDWFNNCVTTYVNTEPLRTNNFPFFAELVNSESGGKSKVVAISHGVIAGNKKMRLRLEKIVELMEKGIIPRFVLTADFARRGGTMSDDENLRHYLETLEILRPALRKVHISVQGFNEKGEGPDSLSRSAKMIEDVLSRMHLTHEEDVNLGRTGRTYTSLGRAAKVLGDNVITRCSVIPDNAFVIMALHKSHRWRGFIRFDGSAYAQYLDDHMKSYNEVLSYPWTKIKL